LGFSCGGIIFGANRTTWSSVARKLGVQLHEVSITANYQYRRLKLQFATMLDTVTVGGTFILPSGQEVSSTELFHLDGKPHPGTLNPGVMISAKWASPRKLETTGTKDGKDVGVVTYEVSADGKTLTSRYSTSPDQVIVFDRQ